jgi:hypothetical protein
MYRKTIQDFEMKLRKAEEYRTATLVLSHGERDTLEPMMVLCSSWQDFFADGTQRVLAKVP